MSTASRPAERSVADSDSRDELHDELQFRLMQALNTGGGAALGCVWASEVDRWHELAFTLLAQVHPGDDNGTRSVTGDLARVGLLQVGVLSSAELTLDKGAGSRIREMLVAAGWTPSDAARGIYVLAAVSRGLETHFAGKVQRYLRHYGELMLSELPEFFETDKLSAAELASAVTYWLQNVLEMPLSLVDPAFDAFCLEYGATGADVIRAADDLDLNLVALDDVLDAVARRTTSNNDQA